MDRIDFRQLFGLLPSPYMVLDHELKFVDMNEAYLAVTGRDRDKLLGMYLMDAFPDPGESGRRLLASFHQVLETGEPDTIPLLPYAIDDPDLKVLNPEIRYWSCVHTPLKDKDGQVIFVLQNTVDVTELQRLKTLAFGAAAAPQPGEKDLLQRTQEVEAANLSLRQQAVDLRELFMQAPSFMAVLNGADLVFTLANNAYLKLIGGDRSVIGKAVLQALPELEGQGFDDLLRQVMATGVPYIGRAVPVPLQRVAGQPPEERLLDFVYQPILGPDGKATGVFVEGVDVTENVRAQEQQKLLLDELNHRVKNTLATVQAIATQTFRSKPDPAEFRKAFEARLHALSQTHNLITAQNWRGASLRDVLIAELSPHGEPHYRIEGPDIDLTPAQALTLGLVFHELVTNAAKYGALSQAEGCVRVTWTLDGDHRLRLTWRESGGPPVTVPASQGFGSRLIERSVAGDLSGTAELAFAPEGLICRLDADLTPKPPLKPVTAGL